MLHCKVTEAGFGRREEEIAMFQTDFSSDVFVTRRRRVLDEIGPNAVAILQGGPKEPGHDVFRQTNDFYYLCGVEVPHSYLLIDGRTSRSILFLPHQSADRREKEGEDLSPDNAETACRLTGVDQVHGIEALSRLLERNRVVYTPLRPAEGATMSWDTLQRAQQDAMADPWDGQQERMRAFVQLLQERVPGVEIRDLSPTIDELRLIKTGAEVDLVRKAGKLTAVAIVEAMRSTKPGVMEYQLDAVMRYVYLTNGARDAGYRAIIAGGANTWYGHYKANDQPLCDGDLVLADCAPDYRYYTSDIGRMWPVNGHYSDIQRELYGFIVELHKVYLKLIRPGAHADEIIREAAEEMTPVIDRTQWSKPIYEASARRALERTHLTHPVGMAVHDVGSYKEAPLRAGLLITLDPMMWVPEEKRYIRSEDTLLMTENGFENLTQDAPLELDEVEALVQQDGMVQQYPAIEEVA
jgi:Xaa-Pro aminopeptidase